MAIRNVQILKDVDLSPEPMSAQSGIHDAISNNDVPAVIFNSKAGVADLLSYAYGQLTMLDEVLLALEESSEDDHSAFPYAMRSILSPAMDAVHLAVSLDRKVLNHG